MEGHEMEAWESLESISWDEICSIVWSQLGRVAYSADDAMIFFVEICERLPHTMQRVRTLNLAADLTFGHQPRFTKLGHRGLSALVQIVNAGYFNQLQTLDLSGHGDLGEDLVAALGKLFQSGHWKQLHELRLRASEMSDREVGILAEYAASGYLSELVSLNLSDNRVGDEGSSSLADSFAAGHLSKVVSLNLSGNYANNYVGATALVNAFASGQCSKMVSLDLSRSNIGDRGATALADSFASGGWTNLEALNLRRCAIENAGVRALAKSFASGSCSKLKSLDFSGNTLGEAGAKALCKSFESGHLSDLLALSLADSELYDGGVVALAGSFESGHVHKLESFDLTNNKIGVVGAKSLGEAIASGHLSNVRTLALSVNEMEDEGVANLVNSFGVGNLSDMKSLDLSSTGMGMEGAISLAQWLQSGGAKNLRYFNLSKNIIGSVGVEALARSFQSGNLSKLERLHLSGNKLGRRGAEALALAFESTKLSKLEKLDLSSDRLGNEDVDVDVDVEALAKAIAGGSMSRLEHLDLSGIPVKEGAMKSLLHAYLGGKWQRCDVKSYTVRLNNRRPLPQSLQHDKPGKSITSRTLHLPFIFQHLSLMYLADGILACTIPGQLQVLYLSGPDSFNSTLFANKRFEGRLKGLRVLSITVARNMDPESCKSLTDGFQSPNASELEYVYILLPEDSWILDEVRVLHSIVEGLACVLQTGKQRNLKVLQLFNSAIDVHRISEVAKQRLVNCYRRNPYLVVRICAEELESESGLMGDIGALRRGNEERVTRLRELESEPDVSGKHGKVFLCGNEGVGKTTLRISLAKEISTSAAGSIPSRVGKLHCLQGCMIRRSQRKPALPPTRGIEVSNIEGSGSSATQPLELALWDLAGQHEYQVLHSTFLPDIALAGGQATFFVLVCGTDKTQAISFESVTYWLRFLSSNSVKDVQEGERRRRVFVVLNCFHGGLSDHNEEHWNIFLGRCRSEFNHFLNLHEDLFIFNATDANQVHKLKATLLNEASRLLQRRKMPQICFTVQENCKEWIEGRRASKGYYPVLTWSEFSFQIGRNCFSDAKLTAAAQYLHEAGHLIFFAQEAEASTSTIHPGAEKFLLIVDPTWFCQNVVGNLLLPERLVTDAEKFQKMWKHVDLENNPLPISTLEKWNFLVPREKLQEVVMLMSRLGLCYQLKTRSESVFIPALIQSSDAPGWYSDWNNNFDQQTWVMGYSLVVKDLHATLLPVAVLRKLQVDLAQEDSIGLRPDSRYVARKFCIAFNSERMKVLIEYPFNSARGYSTEDRIDVLVKPMDPDPSHYASTRVDQTNFAHKIVNRIISITRECCPGVELQRRIVKPWAVRSGWVSLENRDVRTSVEEVKKRVTEGVAYRESGFGKMNWEEPIVSEDELLPEDELAEYKRLILDKYSRTDRAVRKLGLSDVSGQQVIAKAPENPDSMIIFRAVEDLSGKLDALISIVMEMRDDVKEIKGGIHKIAAAQESLNLHLLNLERLSLEDREVLRTVPRFVYLKETGAGSKWRIKLREIFSKAMTLHFLCESPRRGLHEVETAGEAGGQKGVQFEIFEDWVQKLIPVLDWTLRVTFVALKVAGNVALPGLGLALSDLPAGTVTRAIQMASGIPDLWKYISDTFEVGSIAHPIGSHDHSLVDSLHEDSCSSGNDRLRLDTYFELRGDARAAVREIYNKLDYKQKQEQVGLTRVWLDDDHDRHVVWICSQCLKDYGGKAHELQD